MSYTNAVGEVCMGNGNNLRRDSSQFSGDRGGYPDGRTDIVS